MFLVLVAAVIFSLPSVTGKRVSCIGSTGGMALVKDGAGVNDVVDTKTVGENVVVTVTGSGGTPLVCDLRRCASGGGRRCTLGI